MKDDRSELIVEQALEIRRLKRVVSEDSDSFREIHMILYCVGGPLNDNVLGYSKKQMGPLFKIAALSESRAG